MKNEPSITFLLLLVVLCAGGTYGARILAAFLIPSMSHHLVYQPILRELSLRGHELTVITPYPLRDPSLTNLTEIDIGFSYEVLHEMGKSYFEGTTLNPWMFSVLQPLGIFLLMQAELEHPPVKALLNDQTRQFDLVLIEPLHPLQYAYGGRFNCPMVALLAHFADMNVHFAMGNPNHPIAAPDAVLGFTDNLSFLQRVESVLFSVFFRNLYKFVTLPLTNIAARTYFGDIPDLAKLEKNVSVLLTTTHQLLHGVRANVPTVVDLGKVQRLAANHIIPQDLAEFLDSAKEGVVYFSLGSMIKPTALGNKLDFIKETFSELPQKVLWKWEDDFLPGQPRNVKISKWVPQEQVLRHPNVKVFVTHGGPQSIEEALTASVPVVTMPMQFDQFLMSNRAVQLGIGRKLDLHNLDKASFKEALVDVLDNPGYKTKVKELAILIEDQPMNGLDKAVWWIEYVIRHKGTKHLQSPEHSIPFYQYYMLDVVMVVLLALSIAVYLTYKITRFVIRRMRAKVKSS